MIRVWLPGWLVVLVVPAARGPGKSDRTSSPADLVFQHAAVYTMDAARRWASAVAVRDGRIVYVGSDSLPPGLIGPGTEVVLDDLTTAAAIADSIRKCARAYPDRPWVRGGGWQLPIFKDANPSKLLLDQAVPDRPAFFYAADGHSAWVNSKVLADDPGSHERP